MSGKVFTIGQRVTTPYGPGTVAYWRMAPPDFAVVEAVSVRLDSRAGKPGYTGTVIPALDVTALDVPTVSEGFAG